jgi:D-alanyl-D-alanine carboxypeptidase (penicillin-binding protein 5/6)
MAVASRSASAWARRACAGTLVLTLALVAQPGGAGAAGAAGEAVAAPVVAAPSAALVDASNGRVLFARGGDTVRAPASMVKIMTLVLGLRALESGRVRRSDLVAVSDEAYHTGGAQIWLEPGEVLPFGQLLTAVAVGSANDAAVAIAEHLSGSVPAFVAEMNAFARRLGMSHTRFVNPNGLDAPGQATETTALDMARLGVYAARMPELLRFTSTREDRSIRDGKGGHLWLVNTNKLLGQLPGVDGLKTGYTSAAGFCLTATAERAGLRLVAVVMGDASSKARFADTAALLNWGFAHYRAVYLTHRGERLASVPVRGGRSRAVAAVAVRDLTFTVPSGATPAPQATRPEVRLATVVRAPVRAGQVLGRARFALPEGGSASVDLVAASSVARAQPLDLLRRLVGFLPSAS